MNLHVGKIVSHYELVELLGSGGMSVVYKARDLKLDRHVALKFLAMQLGVKEEEKERFIQEAKATSALDHPNICTIYEINQTEDGQLFLAIAYYEGESLREKIDRGPLSVEEAVRLSIQLSEGLAKAHEKGIVHRDIKPANLMITTDNILKIVDFGISKLKGTSGLTRPGVIIGTPAYMAPEQVAGGRIDHRVDIWALGVILFEMLTTVLPFNGDSDLTLMYAIANEEPLPLEKFRPDAPPALRNIILRALAKNPDQRYQNTADVAADLSLLAKAGQAAVVPSPPQASPPHEQSSVAVMPFRDMSPAQDQEYFCDGLAESIMTTLARVEGLRVVSRTSVFRFKNQDLDAREIGRQLNVRAVLEGSLQQAGNQLRISLQLINVDDGFLLWAETIKKEMGDIFQIQDDITQAVVEALKVQLTGVAEQEVSHHYTDDVKAYSAYLKGRYYWNKRTVEGLNKSIEYFTEAADRDGNFALAYAGLADTYTILGIYGAYAPQEVMPRALDMARRALQIDEKLGEAHITLGCIHAVFQWDWAAAEIEFRRGIQLNPNYATAHHWYAINYLVPLARFDLALKEIQQAQYLDPISPLINTTAGLVYYFAGQYDKAIEYHHTALELQPDFAMANFFLGQALVQKAELDSALEHFRQAQQQFGASTNMMATYAHAAGLAGQTEEAQNILNELLHLAREKYVSAYDIASVYLGLGQIDEALQWIKKAFEEHAYLLIYLNVDPILERIRATPLVQELKQKMFAQG
ncbi:MAG: hypothetical protein Kow0042_21410 [Calditrichia bacterium]